jgi:Uma2 family endonuclease
MSTAKLSDNPRPDRVSPEQYLKMERANTGRHSELVDGQIYAMGGASIQHNRIVTNMLTQIGSQLRGRPCDVFANDMRVHVLSDQQFFYPDIVGFCGEAEMLDDRQDTLLNPQLIIEVLSKSTQGFDRSSKLRYYRNIPSLQEHWLVDQYMVYVEQMIRQDDGSWLLREFTDLNTTIQVPSLDCNLTVTDIYDRVEFETVTDKDES